MTVVANSNPRPVRGKSTIDVRGKYVSETDTDCAPGLQAWIDDLAAVAADWQGASGPGGNAVARGFLPARRGGYQINSPVFVDSSRVRLWGEPGTHIWMPGNLGYDALVIGVPRGSGGYSKVPDSTYRPSLAGKLDATATAVDRWGCRFRGDMVLVSHSSALAMGQASAAYPGQPDAWRERRKWAAELAVEGPGGGAMPGGLVLLAIGGDQNGNDPTFFTLFTTSDNSFVLRLGLRAVQFGARQSVDCTWTTGSATGVQRIYFDADLDARRWRAFSGPAASRTLIASGTLPSGVEFAEVTSAQLKVNGFGPSVEDGPFGDWSLYGLAFFNATRYAEDGTRIGSSAINDFNSYFSIFDATCVAFLPLTESPLGAPRHVTAQGGQAGQLAPGSAYLLHVDPADSGRGTLSLNAETTGVRLDDVQVTCQGIYGHAVAIGTVLRAELHGVEASGMRAVANLPSLANYPVRLAGCTLSGTHAGYFGYASIAVMRDVEFARNGRAAIRAVGCNLVVDGATVYGGGSPQYALAVIESGQYGNIHRFDNVLCDKEGDPYLLAGIHAENQANTAEEWLIARAVHFGTIGDAPFFALRGVGDAPTYKSAYIQGAFIGGVTTGPVVDVDGAQWRGSVSPATGNFAAQAVRTSGGFAGPANVTVN